MSDRNDKRDKRDRENMSSLRPEVLEEIRRPDNYHRLQSSRSSSSRNIGSSSRSNSGSFASSGDRKRTNTAGDMRNSGPVALPFGGAPMSSSDRDKRDKYASVGRRDSQVGAGGGAPRKEGRGVDSLPPALKEDLEIFKRELVKHLRKEMLRLKDDLIDDLRREFDAFRQN